MIQKKVCMLGSFAVGKTSLVRRFVKSMFSDKYHTTVGVKIDKKVVGVGEQEMNLLLWDIHGKEKAEDINPSYLRGAAGYLLVVDGTRRATLYTALAIQKAAQKIIGPIPFILLINKSDLAEEWELEDREIEALLHMSWSVIKTSAKTGTGVESAFTNLARKMLEA